MKMALQTLNTSHVHRRGQNMPKDDAEFVGDFQSDECQISGRRHSCGFWFYWSWIRHWCLFILAWHILSSKGARWPDEYCLKMAAIGKSAKQRCPEHTPMTLGYRACRSFNVESSLVQSWLRQCYQSIEVNLKRHPRSDGWMIHCIPAPRNGNITWRANHNCMPLGVHGAMPEKGALLDETWSKEPDPLASIAFQSRKRSVTSEQLLS